MLISIQYWEKRPYQMMTVYLPSRNAYHCTGDIKTTPKKGSKMIFSNFGVLLWELKMRLFWEKTTKRPH